MTCRQRVDAGASGHAVRSADYGIRIGTRVEN